MSDFLKQALEYAARRWCWDDETLLQECYEQSPPSADDTPEGWIDGLAEDYGLLDPRDFL